MEESKYSISRVGLQIGDISEETAKSSIKFKATFNKAAADAQSQFLGSYLTGLNPDLSLVIVFTQIEGKFQALQELLEELLKGGVPEFSAADDISQLFNSGMLSYSFIETADHLVLRIIPGEAVESMVSGFLHEYGTSTGIKDLAVHEEATVTLNVLAGIDFYELLELHKNGYTTLSAFFKAFQVELIGKSLKGSNFGKKIHDIVKSLLPFVSEGPGSMFGLLDTVDIDVALRSIEEAPASVKKSFGSGGPLAFFPRAPSDLQKGEYEFGKKLTEVLKAKIQAYATVDGIVAAEFSLNLPGFGVCVQEKLQ